MIEPTRASSSHLGVTLLQPVRACAVACCKDGHLQQRGGPSLHAGTHACTGTAPCAASCRSGWAAVQRRACVMPSACACLTMSSIHEVRASTSVQAHACSCRDSILSQWACLSGHASGPCVKAGKPPLTVDHAVRANDVLDRKLHGSAMTLVSSCCILCLAFLMKLMGVSCDRGMAAHLV